MNCRRQSHFTKKCRRKGLRPVTNRLRGIKTPQNIKELKGTKECIVKHFTFCYNDRCPVYEEAKYNISYWPQESESEKLKEIKETDRLWELKQDSTATFSPKSAKILIMQEYDRATSNIKNK